jgi:undecaprenyl-diphosphatase
VSEPPASTTTIPADVAYPPATLVRRALLGAGAVLALLLAIGLLVDLTVVGTSVGEADLDATRWIAERRTGVLDSLATIGSSLTDTFTVLGVLGGAVAMLVAAGHGRHALVLVVAVTTEFAGFLVTSYVIGRDRPDVEPLGSVPSTASFPSGHVAVAIALYGGLVLVATSLTRNAGVGRVGAVFVTVTTLFVGASRVYEGVHHPIDVVGGIVLGALALASAGWSSGLLFDRATAATDVDVRDGGHRWYRTPGAEARRA